MRVRVRVRVCVCEAGYAFHAGALGHFSHQELFFCSDLSGIVIFPPPKKQIRRTYSFCNAVHGQWNSEITLCHLKDR